MNDPATVFVATGFFVTVAVTVRSIAGVISRRLEYRRSALPDETEKRLERIEAAVDVIAVEVERIAEAQRFSLRLAEERGIGRPEPRPAQLPEGRVITPH